MTRTAGAAGALLALVYALTLCPTVYVEGSGELAGAACLLGTPHPTGYPLYCLLTRLLAAALPGQNPAWVANLSTAAAAAAAGAALAGLLQARGLRVPGALAGALLFGLGRTFWSQAVIAEVYGLASLLLVLAAWAGLRAAASPGARTQLLAGYVLGVGLTTHLSQALMAPALLAAIVRPCGRLRSRLQALARIALAAAAGYSLVLYLPLRNGRGSGFHWSDLGSVSLLVDHLTAAIYRPSFFALPPAAMLENAARWLRALAVESGLLALPLMALGAASMWRRDRALAGVLGGLLLLNLLTALNYHRDPNGIAVFFLPTFLVAAAAAAFGIDWVARRRGSRTAAAGAGLVVLAALLANWDDADRRQARLAHEYGMALLDTLPEGAVLLAEGDETAFVLDYLLRVERHRPDVTLYNRDGLGTDLLHGSERRLPLAARHQLRRARERELVHATRGGVFYVAARDLHLPADYTVIPYGLLYRAVPRDSAAELPMPSDRYDSLLDQTIADPWLRRLQANVWFMRGERARAQGQIAPAIERYEQAARTAPESRTLLFNVALALLHCGDLARAKQHARAALHIDPWLDGPRQLLSRIERIERAPRAASQAPGDR